MDDARSRNRRGTGRDRSARPAYPPASRPSAAFRSNMRPIIPARRICGGSAHTGDVRAHPRRRHAHAGTRRNMATLVMDLSSTELMQSARSLRLHPLRLEAGFPELRVRQDILDPESVHRVACEELHGRGGIELQHICRNRRALIVRGNADHVENVPRRHGCILGIEAGAAAADDCIARSIAFVQDDGARARVS